MGPRARVVDQLSQATRSWVRVPADLTKSPGRLGPGSECLRCRPTSRETWDRVGGSAGLTCLSGESGPCPRAHGFNKHPGRLWTLLGAVVSNSCPRELALGPRAPGVDQLSLATRASVRVPEGSKSSPGRLALGFQGPRGRPDVFGESGPGPSAHGVDQVSWLTRARTQGPAGSTSSPGQIGPGPEVPLGRPPLPGHLRTRPRTRVFNQLSRATRAQVRGPAGSASCPGGLGPMPERLRVRPAVLGDLGPCQWTRCVDQPSRASQTRARGPVVFTSTPGGLRPFLRARVSNSCLRGLVLGSEDPRCQPVVPGDSGTSPRARRIDHLSQATQAGTRGPAVSTNSAGRIGFWSEVPRSTTCPG